MRNNGPFLKKQKTQIKGHKRTNLCKKDTKDTNFWLLSPNDNQKFVSDTNPNGILLLGQNVEQTRGTLHTPKYKTVKLKHTPKSPPLLAIIQSFVIFSTSDQPTSTEKMDTDTENSNAINANTNQNVVQVPKATKGNGKNGKNNYSREELLSLFAIMEWILHIGTEEWEQVVLKHSKLFPRRHAGSIRCKYNTLHRK